VLRRTFYQFSETIEYIAYNGTSCKSIVSAYTHLNNFIETHPEATIENWQAINIHDSVVIIAEVVHDEPIPTINEF